jgi:hypothetical protein
MKHGIARTALALTTIGAIAALAPAAAASAADNPAPATAGVAAGQPISPAYCSGDLCLRIYLPANAPNFDTIIVREWASKYTFFGHFELQVPGVSRPYNSNENTNYAGATGHLFTVPNNDGRFTARAWQRTGSDSWVSVGATGFTGAYI